MSSLRDTLFPDTNITGFVDKYNQPILVGHKLIDSNGSEVEVFKSKDGYVVQDKYKLISVSNSLSLGLYMVFSHGDVEIIKEFSHSPMVNNPFADVDNLGISESTNAVVFDQQKFIDNIPSPDERERILEGLKRFPLKSKPTNKTRRNY